MCLAAGVILLLVDNRCQELEQVGAEQQRVAELEHYIAQLRITISRQEGAEQGPEFEAGPPKRPRNGSTESTPVCSAAPRVCCRVSQ